MEAAEKNHKGMIYLDEPEFENHMGMIYLDEPEFRTAEELFIERNLIRRLIKAKEEGKEITEDDKNRMLEDITTEVKILLEEDTAERQRMEEDAVERERMEEDACMQVKIGEDEERYSQWRRSEQRCPGYSRFMMHSCSTVKSEKKQKEIKNTQSQILPFVQKSPEHEQE